MVVEVALQAGMLDKWRLEDDRLHKKVYEVAATYPFTLEGLDLGDFVGAAVGIRLALYSLPAVCGPAGPLL